MTMRVVLVNDELPEDDENYAVDITEEFNEIADENTQLTEYLEEVTAGFEEESGIALSQNAELVLASRHGVGFGEGMKGNRSNFVINAPSQVAMGKNKIPPGIGTGKAAHASLGKHLQHAAKVVGRHAKKAGKTASFHAQGMANTVRTVGNTSVPLKHIAAVSAASLAAKGVVNHIAKRRAKSLEASQQLQLDENEELLEEDELTQEELDTMTPEQAADLLENEYESLSAEDQAELEAIADEESHKAGLEQFAQNVLVQDAESRTPAKS